MPSICPASTWRICGLACRLSLPELEKIPVSLGRLRFLAGAECRSVSPYLTSYVAHVYQTAAALKYDVDAGHDAARLRLPGEGAVGRAACQRRLVARGTPRGGPFEVKGARRGRRNQDSTSTACTAISIACRSFCHRVPARRAAGEGEAGCAARRAPASNEQRECCPKPARFTSRSSRIRTCCTSEFNIRSTAIALTPSCARESHRPLSADRPVADDGRARTGRWAITQENAIAMQALVNYYRKYESVTPNFTATSASAPRICCARRSRGDRRPPSRKMYRWHKLAAPCVNGHRADGPSRWRGDSFYARG